MLAFLPRQEQESVKNNSSNTSTALNNFNSSSKMTLFVRSKKVAVMSKTVLTPVYVNGLVGPKISKRIVIYENVLDQEQKVALENSAALARNLGIELEVRDIARQMIFARIISLLFRDKLVVRTPSVSFAGEAISSLVSASYAKNVPGNYRVSN